MITSFIWICRHSLWKGNKNLSVTCLRAIDNHHLPIPPLPKGSTSHRMVIAEGFELYRDFPEILPKWATYVNVYVLYTHTRALNNWSSPLRWYQCSVCDVERATGCGLTELGFFQGFQFTVWGTLGKLANFLILCFFICKTRLIMPFLLKDDTSTCNKTPCKAFAHSGHSKDVWHWWSC